MEIRYVWRFLVLPLHVKGETRWLEWALLRQSCEWFGWRTIEFAKSIPVPND